MNASSRGSSLGPIRVDVVFSLSRQSSVYRPGVLLARVRRLPRLVYPRCIPTSFWWRSRPSGAGSGRLAVLALAGVIICRCVAAALRAADGFCSLLALGIAALTRYSGAFDLRWNLAGFAFDRAHTAAGFVRGHVNRLYSVRTRNRVGDRSGRPGLSVSSNGMAIKREGLPTASGTVGFFGAVATRTNRYLH